MMIAIGFPVTLVLAVASWTWIEAPALANRHVLAAQWRLRRLRAREAASAAAS
jgi:peptidoglycan/LPS O-acetylase OafA/YrhL